MINAKIIIETDGQLTEVRRSDIDPAVAVARCLAAVSEFWASGPLEEIADQAHKIAIDRASGV